MEKKRSYWCTKCNIPILNKECGICGKSGKDLGIADLRPVFVEELEFIRAFSDVKLLSRFTDFSIWSIKRDYFYKGGKLAKVLPNLKENKLAVKIFPVDGQKKVKIKGTFLERLRQGNIKHIQELEYKACNLVQQTAADNPERLPTVSFSGGKDSVVVSHIVRKALGESRVVHIFGDTTIEAPDTYNFIEHFKKQYPLTPIIVSKPNTDFFELCEKIAPPSRIQRWCCTTHKSASLGQVINVINNSSGVISYCGIRREESSSRAGYDEIMDGDKIAGQIMVNPILEWSTLELWIYILLNDIPINPAYKKGFVRMGCFPCPFNSDWWEFLGRYYYKDEFSKWRETLVKYAVASGKTEPEQYVDDGIWKSRVGGMGLDAVQTKIRKEQCYLNNKKYKYTLQRSWDDSFWDFLKPLGNLQNISSCSVYCRKVLISGTGEAIAFIKAVYPTNMVEIELASTKNIQILKSHIDRQIRKFQCCVLCGACEANCRNNAINTTTQYSINASKCTHCGDCVRKFDDGCVAAHSLNYNENRKEVKV